MENLLNPSKITEKSIDKACERIQGFAFVNKNRSDEEKVQSIDILIKSLGLTDNTLKYLRNRLSDFTSSDEGPMLLGALIGIYIAEEYYS
jgi:hypothetical protein